MVLDGVAQLNGPGSDKDLDMPVAPVLRFHWFCLLSTMHLKHMKRS